MIALIRGSADVDEARTGLMESFDFREIQAQAILEMRLQRLTGLERKLVEDEYTDLQERIAELRAILGDTARSTLSSARSCSRSSRFTGGTTIAAPRRRRRGELELED